MLHIVWFKRDLRIYDHAPLFEAAKTSDKIIPLYILEPELWQQPDLSGRHYDFLCECLSDLNQQLNKKLIIKVGHVTDILENIKKEFPKITLWSHLETWNGWTYQRDIKVKKWCQNNSIIWHELQNFGVFRKLKSRDDWADLWHQQMYQPILPAPEHIDTVNIPSDTLPDKQTFNLSDICPQRQQGGREIALMTLNSFLYDRGEHYTKEMSSPVTAFESCSRISPYISFGCISMREVFQIACKREKEIQELPYSIRGKWSSALRSFLGRLRWHCHFIQKLEDSPKIEFENMNHIYNNLRENDFNPDYFEAWKTGHTGYPMIDSSMRALIATGWINFRMRAMLMSFAAYHLWLHWREPALYLAKLFTDYEPGIHYSQIQMQSGTTGINAVRIYNPIKQGTDQDPDGVFIRKWLPELKDIPDKFIHTPWKNPSNMGSYPMPIIDEKTARKQAADKIYALRKTLEHKETAKQVFIKHGSRKKRNTSFKKPTNTSRQGELF